MVGTERPAGDPEALARKVPADLAEAVRLADLLLWLLGRDAPLTIEQEAAVSLREGLCKMRDTCAREPRCAIQAGITPPTAL